MRNRILTSALALMSLVLASLACSLPGSGGTSPTGEAPAESGPSGAGAGNGACANPLYPVVTGASWTYSFNGAAPGNFTRSITAVNADGFLDQDVFDSGISRSGEWKCDNGSLIALKPDSGASTADVQSQNVSATFQTTAMSGVTLPGTVNPGESWSQNFSMEGVEHINGMDIPARSDTSFTCTGGATESVIVPAGTFNAMRMDCSTNIAITITMNDTDIPTNVATTSTMWYAPGVGMVKTDSVVGTTGNITLELTAYNIP
ncbi:MAG: hypothetical protein K8S20_09500 [Chloroflexi bacterium]|nr:hypothetical protein [Chloroflexota bacterium]